MNATLKTLIVDDEPLARDLLASMLSAHPEVEVIGTAGSVAEARAFLESETPDLVFLDMEMPGASGLDLRDDLPPGTRTIFVTAFADYALEAFDFGARGYLLKPVDPSRLALVLERLGAEPSGAVGGLAETVAEGGKISCIPLERILWIEACQNYTLVRQVDLDALVLVSRTLSEWVRLLPAQSFERLSRSLIVRLPPIQAVRWQSRDETFVDFLDCKHHLSLGRTAALRLKARLKERSTE
ncbi:MAG: LytR/AlgR family response regulator transcription factor [Terrimicrobiaceae bacterium]